MLYVIVSPVVEHNNGRLNTTGLGHTDPTPPATHNDVRFRERSRTLWNFTELCNRSDGTEQLCYTQTDRCDRRHYHGRNGV